MKDITAQDTDEGEGVPCGAPYATVYVIDLETGRVVDDGRYETRRDALARADEYNRRTRRSCGVFVLVKAFDD